MRDPFLLLHKGFIPLFAKRRPHPFAPLGHAQAGTRSAGQGRPTAGACALPLTAVSTLAGWRRRGDKAVSCYVVLLFVGVLFAGTGMVAVCAQAATTERAHTRAPYATYVAEAAQRFGIPTAWIEAVLGAESSGDVRAISPKGAMGLMQVMPDTWAALRVRYHLGRDPYDAHDNIMAGAAYLREMHDRYGTLAGMLAAYNAGPARYDDFLSRGRALPAETQGYVAAIAPLIGGGEIANSVAAVSLRVFGWMRAPLFVTQTERTSSADRVPFGGNPAAAFSRDMTAITPQSGDLFVVRAAARMSP